MPPIDTPARGELMLALPCVLPLHLENNVSAAAAASLPFSLSSWVTGTGTGFPFGLIKWYVNCGVLASAGFLPAGVSWFKGGSGVAASISFWMRMSVAILFPDAFSRGFFGFRCVVG